MPKIIVEKGNDKGKQVLLSGRGTILVGRDPKAQVTVVDTMVSRQHCKIFTKNDKYYLRDLGSSNGTVLNGKRVQESELREGDNIQIGETLMTFANEREGTTKDPMIGKVVDGYRIHERVGRGGMGTVYRATQLSLNRVVAFKVLSQELVKDVQFIELFRKEARSAAQMNHPNVVGVYDVGKQKGTNTYYISMEYMSNGSIQDLIGRNLKLPVDEALPFFLDAARGLEYAHKRNIVHRDIKPDNLMLNEDRIVKIGDLGLAKNLSETSEEEGIFGTPHYIAPEQALGKAVDIRADLYALGGTFYRVIAGQTPFTGPSIKDIVRKQIKEKAKPLAEVAPEVPLEVCRIIHKLMEKDPNERYQTPTELIDDLEKFRRRSENPDAESMPIPSAMPHRTLITALVVVLLLVAIGGVIHLITSGETPDVVGVDDQDSPVATPGDDDDDGSTPVSSDPKYGNWLTAKDHLSDNEGTHRRDAAKLQSLHSQFSLALNNTFADTTFVEEVRAFCEPKIREYAELQKSLQENQRTWREHCDDAVADAKAMCVDQRFGEAMTRIDDAIVALDATMQTWSGILPANGPVALPANVLPEETKQSLRTPLVSQKQVVDGLADAAWERTSKAAEAQLEALKKSSENLAGTLKFDIAYYDSHLKELESALAVVDKTWKLKDRFGDRAAALLNAGRDFHAKNTNYVYRLQNSIDQGFFTNLDFKIFSDLLPAFDFEKAISWLNLSMEPVEEWKKDPVFAGNFAASKPITSERVKVAITERIADLKLQQAFFDSLAAHVSDLRKQLKKNAGGAFINENILPQVTDNSGKPVRLMDFIVTRPANGKSVSYSVELFYGDDLAFTTTTDLQKAGVDIPLLAFQHYMTNNPIAKLPQEVCLQAAAFFFEYSQSPRVLKDPRVKVDVVKILNDLYEQAVVKFGYQIEVPKPEVLLLAKLVRKRLIRTLGTAADQSAAQILRQLEDYLSENNPREAEKNFEKLKQLQNTIPVLDYEWKVDTGLEAIRKRVEAAGKIGVAPLSCTCC